MDQKDLGKAKTSRLPPKSSKNPSGVQSISTKVDSLKNLISPGMGIWSDEISRLYDENNGANQSFYGRRY